MNKVYFYIPGSKLPNALPKAAEGFWHWQNAHQGRYRRGRFNWTLQAYLHLKDAGVPCELTGSFPDTGIVIVHRDFLPSYRQPSLQQLIVCIQADRQRHPYAQIHIVQNEQDASESQAVVCQRPLARGRYHIKLWRQPDLIPRDPNRGNLFKTVAYFGLQESLADELKSPDWSRALRALGLEWRIVPPESWHDYSQADAVLSARSFQYSGRYLYKPPSKLINAWHAGVPAVLAAESGFQAERCSDLDYIEFSTQLEALAALEKLKQQPKLRTAMVKNGHQRAEATQTANLVEDWKTFLSDVAEPAYENWCRLPAYQKTFFLQRQGIQDKLVEPYQMTRQQLTPSSQALDPTLDPVHLQ